MTETTADEPSRREFFWSGRTLRCDVWVQDDVLGEFLDRTEDCLSVDAQRCIVAHEPYSELILKLLNAHFAKGAKSHD